jgi:hypothetical protein
MKKLFLFTIFFILSTTAQSQSKGWGEYSKTDKLTGVKSPAYMMIQEKMDIPGFPKAMLQTEVMCSGEKKKRIEITTTFYNSPYPLVYNRGFQSRTLSFKTGTVKDRTYIQDVAFSNVFKRSIGSWMFTKKGDEDTFINDIPGKEEIKLTNGYEHIIQYDKKVINFMLNCLEIDEQNNSTTKSQTSQSNKNIESQSNLESQKIRVNQGNVFEQYTMKPNYLNIGPKDSNLIFLDLNRKIKNSDGTVTIELVRNSPPPSEHIPTGTKSFAFTLNIDCSELPKSTGFHLDYSAYSEIMKGGEYLEVQQQPNKKTRRNIQEFIATSACN